MAHHAPTGPFTLPAINNVIPEKAKPWIYILFVIIFQFSGGIYLAIINEMAGAEDLMMAGYASLAGMTLVYTIMLRLKMRFTSRFSLIVTSIGLILANIITLNTTSMPVLVFTCFTAGMLRMWATFECNSSIQLWLTPKRDLSVFFCYIYILVQGSILLSGAGNLWIAFYSTYEYMHWLIIGSLLFVILFAMVFFNSNRQQRPFPLFGIDWLGGFLWGLSLLAIIYIAVYGSHYDWWYGEEIIDMMVFFFIILGLNLYRASFIRHPFIPLGVFKYRYISLSIFLYLIIDVFLAPSHLIESIYFGMLNYDMKHLVSLNLAGFVGVVIAAVFTYYYFAKAKRSYKSTFYIGFTAILGYLVLMYFSIGYGTAIESLYLPILVRNFGYVVVAIVLLTGLTRIPFHHFFQALSVQSFIGVATGSIIGSAFVEHLFKHIFQKNYSQISASFDAVNHKTGPMELGQIMGMVEQQAMMVSFKELYGWLIIAAVIFYILSVFYKYPYYPQNVKYPKLKTIKRYLRKVTAG
ncbi:MAG: hypothetical protein I8H68_07300 [Flavobacteriia bacterium]|nr:hypothetical protein [Flavobacteriia bacterium]